MSRVAGAERAQPFLLRDALESAVRVRAGCPAVERDIDRAALGVLGVLRPGDDRTRGVAALREERVLPRLRAIRLFDTDRVSRLLLDARDHARELRLQRRVERGRRSNDWWRRPGRSRRVGRC